MGGSVTVSGDTAPSENLVRLACGTDLLPHEAIDFDWVAAAYAGESPGTAAATIEHHRKAHTSPSQAGEIAARADAARIDRESRLAQPHRHPIHKNLPLGGPVCSAHCANESGLRYDPDAGTVVRLSCSASGMEWLSQLSENEALEKIYRQGIGSRAEFGPQAPTTLEELRAALAETHERGWATVDETWAVGTAALAAPIIDEASTQVVGVVSIARPNVLLTEARRHELSSDLLLVCSELSHAVQTAQSVFA